MGIRRNTYRNVLIALVSLAFFGSAQAAGAEKDNSQPQGNTATHTATGQSASNRLSKQQAEHKLVGQGYSQITSMHRKNGSWVGRGIRDNVTYRFTVDRQSGAVTEHEIHAAYPSG